MTQETNKKPTFEQYLAELEKIVSQIESGQIGLEESIQRYEKGTRLIQQCRTILDAAEKQIQLLAKSEQGELAVDGQVNVEEGQ
jgi:exodeoxyribonuclease VII small subunit